MTAIETTTHGASVAKASDRNAERPGEPGLLDRFLALTPLYRAAIAIAVALILWFFAQDYTWAAAKSLNESCDRMTTALEEGKDRSSLIEADKSVRDAIVAMGQIAIPRAEKDGTQELTKAILAVMKANKIEGHSLDVRAGAKLPPSALTQIAGPNGRVQKVIGELKFEAAQDVVARIVQELESRPEIESLSRVKLSRKEGNDKKVAVQITAEAWIQVTKTVEGGA